MQDSKCFQPYRLYVFNAGFFLTQYVIEFEYLVVRFVLQIRQLVLPNVDFVLPNVDFVFESV